ncbi:MAG: RNA polymerase sigma factor [Patescibacteria group bacterium]|nr:RNA polymerase sigma factor [Patescibacteria group bacterium]
MDNYSDEQLVEVYLKGEREALNILIKRYLTPIFNYALSFVKDQAAAEDLTQEVFVKVWRKIKKFDNKYKFKNWLYAIAKNICLDYFKKNKTINFSELDLTDDNLLFENLIKEAAISPQEELESIQAADLVNAAVDKLPEKYKQTVKLHYLDGFKFREIADMLSESIETIKSRGRRGLELLRKMMK